MKKKSAQCSRSHTVRIKASLLLDRLKEIEGLEPPTLLRELGNVHLRDLAILAASELTTRPAMLLLDKPGLAREYLEALEIPDIVLKELEGQLILQKLVEVLLEPRLTTEDGKCQLRISNKGGLHQHIQLVDSPALIGGRADDDHRLRIGVKGDLLTLGRGVDDPLPSADLLEIIEGGDELQVLLVFLLLTEEIAYHVGLLVSGKDDGLDSMLGVTHAIYPTGKDSIEPSDFVQLVVLQPAMFIKLVHSHTSCQSRRKA